MPTQTAPRSILPPNLGALLDVLVVQQREELIVRGWSRECAENEHDLALWRTGLYTPPVSPDLARAFPGIRPEPVLLHLYMCRNCEMVEVRDRTLDRIVDGGKRIASGRRDGLLGWYAGARRANRVYL